MDGVVVPLDVLNHRCVELETGPSITNQLLNCPSPVLKSVSPSSGPFGGGTRLTITGTDLGVTVGDIANVTVGGVNCSACTARWIQTSTTRPNSMFRLWFEQKIVPNASCKPRTQIK